MTSAANSVAARVKAAFEASDPVAMAACYTDDAVLHHPIFGDLKGAEGIGAFDAGMAGSLISDIRFDIEQVIEQGDSAAVCVRVSGIHIGPFPKPDGSVVDLVAHLGQEVSVDEVNARFADEADNDGFKGILRYSDDPIVSTDIVGSEYSSIFDSELTMARGNEVKVFGWYDNEWGYSCRLVDLVERLL